MLNSTPAQDVFWRNKSIQQRYGGLGYSWFVVELDDEWQINVEAKQVRCMYHAILAETRNPAQDNHSLDTVLVMKNVQHLLHERSSPPMVGFTEVNTNDHHFVVHEIPPYRLRAM